MSGVVDDVVLERTFLLGDEEEMVAFPLLDVDILAIEQDGGIERTGRIAILLLVHAQRTLLDHLASLTLG